MSRAVIAAALAVAAGLWGFAAGPGSTAQPSSGTAFSPGRAPSPGAVTSVKGTGRLVAAGTITAVDPSARTVTFAIAGTGRLERFEGGSTWRPGTMIGSHLVHLLPVTLLLDGESRAIPMASLRAGEPASVWAVVGVDSSLRALTLRITPSRPGVAVPPRAEETAPAAAGVVLKRSGQVFTLLTSSGASRNVVLTQATVVRIGGSLGKPESIAPYDVIRVGGTVNSDGSVAATRIDVDFAMTSGVTVAGPVEEQVSALGGLVVQGTMVCTYAETYVIHHNARGTAAELTPARSVTVYGTPMKDGSTPVGLEARVVVVQ
jgi:hypothetical protein